MGGATREFFLEVLRDALRILEAARADHLVIGSLATGALLRRGLDASDDVDVLIRARDAERLLDTFSGEGYATHRRDERWIYKVARPDVTIDLIFRAGEVIELDEEHLKRATTADLAGVPLPVPAPEDLAVMKAVFDGEDRRGRFYEALSILRACPIDWDYLVERGREQAPRRTLALLAFAADDGIDVPDGIVARLRVP
jgi:hypothetical protein